MEVILKIDHKNIGALIEIINDEDIDKL